MNKLELAQALATRRGYEWQDLHPEETTSFGPGRAELIADVNAILAELREPDDRMIKAALRPAENDYDLARDVWQAMIDAIE